MNLIFNLLLDLLEWTIVALTVWGAWRHPYIALIVFVLLLPFWVIGYLDIRTFGEIRWDESSRS